MRRAFQIVVGLLLSAVLILGACPLCLELSGPAPEESHACCKPNSGVPSDPSHSAPAEQDHEQDCPMLMSAVDRTSAVERMDAAGVPSLVPAPLALASVALQPGFVLIRSVRFSPTASPPSNLPLRI